MPRSRLVRCKHPIVTAFQNSLKTGKILYPPDRETAKILPPAREGIFMPEQQTSLDLDVECPYCRSAVPAGARVCTGCQAERSLRNPVEKWGGYGVLGAVLGGWAGFGDGKTWGYVLFGISLLTAVWAVSCPDRVTWQRPSSNR